MSSWPGPRLVPSLAALTALAALARPTRTEGAGIAPTMAAIPRTTFVMGCQDAACHDNTAPARAVQVDAFEIDVYEVTRADYAACLRDGGCTPVALARGVDTDERLPMTGVSWREGVAYCAWRGARLPTEAEWELAARGPESLRNPWGEAPPSCETSALPGCGVSLAPVGAHPGGVSPYGVHDLVGNAWELVADGYDPLGWQARGPDTPPSPLSGFLRTVRGAASWDVDRVHAANRLGMPAEARSVMLGFRCARSTP